MFISHASNYVILQIPHGFDEKPELSAHLYTCPIVHQGVSFETPLCPLSPVLLCLNLSKSKSFSLCFRKIRSEDAAAQQVEGLLLL